MESVLNFEETDVNSLQDSEVFMGHQVPSNNLRDLVMLEIEELMDYKDSNRDDQRWTDGLGEEVPLTDESGKSLDE